MDNKTVPKLYLQMLHAAVGTEPPPYWCKQHDHCEHLIDFIDVLTRDLY
jgi:hypothetical protein